MKGSFPVSLRVLYVWDPQNKVADLVSQSTKLVKDNFVMFRIYNLENLSSPRGIEYKLLRKNTALLFDDPLLNLKENVRKMDPHFGKRPLVDLLAFEANFHAEKEILVKDIRRKELGNDQSKVYLRWKCACVDEVAPLHGCKIQESKIAKGCTVWYVNRLP
jgi:hypothetical protein